jgi:putative ABC transport system ATP-binding protein
MESVVEVRNLTKIYKQGRASVTALLDASFQLNKGEFLAVMGPSGSGKSTLLHLIGGLDKPTSGEVLIKGRLLNLLSDKTVTLLRRREIGFIFQFFNLIPTLTAEENVALPLAADGLSPAKYRAKVESLLDLVGLLPRRNHYPSELSGGEQQRVAIARALVIEPVVLLADEPTGNLDTKTGAEILSLLRKTRDELKQTIILVTHDVAAASCADRVLFLHDGRIIDDFNLEGNKTAQLIKKLGMLGLR